jgi:PDGLE domain-containing protein
MVDKKKKNVIVVLFLVSLAMAFFISPFASSNLDGLEKVAEKLGFIDRGEESVWETSPMPDYTAYGDSRLSGMLAGIIGTLILFGLGVGAGVLLKRTDGNGNDESKTTTTSGY